MRGCFPHLRITQAVILVLLCLGVQPSVCTAQRAVELTISVPASLGDVMGELKTIYEKEHPEIKLALNSGSSGALLAQIVQGAPIDILISASEQYTDVLAQKGLTSPHEIMVLAYNDIVLVQPAGKNNPAPLHTWSDLAKGTVRRLALGNPDHVPAGQYGKEVLVSIGLWDGVQTKIVLGEDVRQVANYVAMGVVNAGIVYRTDAKGNPALDIVAVAPPGSHSPVRYTVALLKRSTHPAQAQALIHFLVTPSAQAVFRRYGFVPPS